VSNFSPIDPVHAVNLAQYPLFNKARPMTCELIEGDALYMPPFTWHRVTRYSTHCVYCTATVLTVYTCTCCLSRRASSWWSEERRHPEGNRRINLAANFWFSAGQPLMDEMCTLLRAAGAVPNGECGF
jgi:hypothetical protein